MQKLQRFILIQNNGGIKKQQKLENAEPKIKKSLVEMRIRGKSYNKLIIFIIKLSGKENGFIIKIFLQENEKNPI